MCPQELPEAPGCGERRPQRDMPVVERTVDNERGERRALVDEEARLPAGRSAPYVEPRLVAEHAPRDVRDPLFCDLGGEPVDLQ